MELSIGDWLGHKVASSPFLSLSFSLFVCFGLFDFFTLVSLSLSLFLPSIWIRIPLSWDPWIWIYWRVSSRVFNIYMIKLLENKRRNDEDKFSFGFVFVRVYSEEVIARGVSIPGSRYHSYGVYRQWYARSISQVSSVGEAQIWHAEALFVTQLCNTQTVDWRALKSWTDMLVMWLRTWWSGSDGEIRRFLDMDNRLVALFEFLL